MTQETIEMLVGTGTLGSIVTMVIQKIFNRKQDTTQNASNTVEFLTKINERLDLVITQLQDAACYRDPCNDRINGNAPKCETCQNKKTS